MSKGPLDGLLKVYNKCVKEADKKGFADIYKKATDVLFERIKKETELDLHFEDVAFGDGYFIFGYGTNSVVHFHIKEAPGWLFGIWWSPVETEETKNKKRKEYITDQVYCELFAQYEEEIDKFKPTASTFCSSFRLHFDENYYDGFINGCADIRFIVKEPYLAFYREMHCVDFNHEYVSRETAKRYWNRHWKEKAKDKANDKLNAQTMFNTVKHIIDPIVKGGDAFILDEGSNVNPRYQIFIRNVNLSDGKPLVEEEGFYGLFDFDYPDRKADEKLWKRTEKECAKREYGGKYYFHNPFSKDCIIRNTKSYNKILASAIKNNELLYGKLKDGTIFEGEVKSRFEK